MSKTYIEVAPNGIASGAVSRTVQPGSAMAAHIQVNLGTATAVAIEGAIINTERSTPQNGDFVEYDRITSSGIHPTKMLPSVYRFRAIGGDVALVAVVHYPDAKMVPDVLPPSANDVESLVDPLIQPVQALAAQADSKADTASNALGNLTLNALNARTQADGPQLVDGSRWVWQASGTPNGGTIVTAAGGGVWVREYSGPLDPRWFGAVPHVEGQQPVDSGAALEAWIAAVEIGQTLATDRVFYTGRELVCNIDSVTVDWQGQLRPMPGYTGFLLRITGLGTPKRQFPASLWQTTARLYALNIDGENRSRGVWFQHLDHYVVENVQVRRTNGCAIRIDACREGAFRNLLACLSRQGTDRGVVEFVDQNAGADANNTMRVYDLKSIYNLGTHLAIDTPLAAQSAGSAARLIDFYGIQIETVGDTVGNSQLDNVFTPTITNGQFVASQVYDPTVDLVTIRNANVINFFGGHFFFDTVQLPAGGVARGGVGIRLGYDSEANLSNSATNISFHRCAMFAHNGDGFIFGLHFAQNILTDVVLLDGLNTRPLAWVSDSSSDAATRLDRTWVTTPAATAAFKAVGTGGAASAAYAMRSGNSTSEAQLYMFPHQVYIKPDAGTDVQHVMDSQGRVWVAGAAKGQLGIPGAEYEQVRLQSGDGSKKLRLYVATDGRLLATDEVQTWEVNRTQV